MKKQVRYSPEIREQAVRLVHEQKNEYESQWVMNPRREISDSDYDNQKPLVSNLNDTP